LLFLISSSADCNSDILCALRFPHYFLWGATRFEDFVLCAPKNNFVIQSAVVFRAVLIELQAILFEFLMA